MLPRGQSVMPRGALKDRLGQSLSRSWKLMNLGGAEGEEANEMGCLLQLAFVRGCGHAGICAQGGIGLTGETGVHQLHVVADLYRSHRQLENTNVMDKSVVLVLAIRAVEELEKLNRVG